MSRGGARSGAGSKSTWKSGKTKTIRVPIALAEAVLAYARQMDEGSVMIEPVTNSKVLNLSGISVRSQNGSTIVCLEDLLRVGYEILPKNLYELVNSRLKKLKSVESLKIGEDSLKEFNNPRNENQERTINRLAF